MGEIIQTPYGKENGPTGGRMSPDDFRLHGKGDAESRGHQERT